MKSKNNQEALPAWDLSDLYKGTDDPKVNADMEKYRKGVAAFAKKYKGKLESLDAKAVLALLKNQEKLAKIGSRLGGFAYLNMSTQMKNPEAMAFYQNISEKLTEYAKPSVFFSLEFNRLPETKIKEWLKDKEVAFYKPYFKRIRKYKKYELSEPVEEILLEKSITSSFANARLTRRF